LGELAYISLQAVGLPVKRGESIGMLEAAKMTIDLVAPVSGIIVARNEQAIQNPGLVNRDPYGEGWLLALEPSRWEEESQRLITGPAVLEWAARALAERESQES
jgi:glycine cleavage system H protein